MTSRYPSGITKQIAVKLPGQLVDEIDRLVAGGAFDSRSQAVRSALEAIVAAKRREEIDRQYRDAMARLPETNEEIAEATRLGFDAIVEEPWERWW
jgi:Arc/MetJ-type ribon-helix-helix transcriptional regulator